MNGKNTKPKLVATHMVENTIKAALKQKDTSLLAEIKDLNLTAKEFKYLEKYYKEYLHSDLVKRLENRDSQLQVRI